MRDLASSVKCLKLIAPISMAATVTGSGVQFTPNEGSGDAIAVVSLGAVTGAPDSFTAIVTIEQSATSGGSYTVTKTFATATAGGVSAHLPVTLDLSKPFVRAKVTLAFVNGTSPAITAGVNILVAQNVRTDSNETALA